MVVYVDTSAWIALHEPRDTRHQAATAAVAEIIRTRTPMRTGHHTIVEFLDGLEARQGQAHAARAARQLQGNQMVRLVPSDPVFDAAVDILEARKDWGVDLSDCLSFALMESLGIRRAFTYDKDFEKAGFEVVG